MISVLLNRVVCGRADAPSYSDILGDETYLIVAVFNAGGYMHLGLLAKDNTLCTANISEVVLLPVDDPGVRDWKQRIAAGISG